jgi:hypothetical protein
VCYVHTSYSANGFFQLLRISTPNHELICRSMESSPFRAERMSIVQVQLTGEYEHSPIVTADNTLTLVKKETGIG